MELHHQKKIFFWIRQHIDVCNKRVRILNETINDGPFDIRKKSHMLVCTPKGVKE